MSVCLLTPPSLIREPPGVWCKKAHTLPINLEALGGPVQYACISVQFILVHQCTVLIPLTEPYAVRQKPSGVYRETLDFPACLLYR